MVQQNTFIPHLIQFAWDVSQPIYLWLFSTDFFSHFCRLIESYSVRYFWRLIAFVTRKKNNNEAQILIYNPLNNIHSIRRWNCISKEVFFRPVQWFLLCKHKHFKIWRTTDLYPVLSVLTSLSFSSMFEVSMLLFWSLFISATRRWMVSRLALDSNSLLLRVSCRDDSLPRRVRFSWVSSVT